MEFQVNLPDRNDSADERFGAIDDCHQPFNGRQIGQRTMAHLNLLLPAGRNRRQLRLLAVVDQGVMDLRVIAEKIEQVQRAAGQRGIDDHHIEWRGAVFDQRQQLRQVLHRCHPVVAKLVEQALDSHPLKMLLVGNQDT